MATGDIRGVPAQLQPSLDIWQPMTEASADYVGTAQAVATKGLTARRLQGEQRR